MPSGVHVSALGHGEGCSVQEWLVRPCWNTAVVKPLLHLLSGNSHCRPRPCTSTSTLLMWSFFKTNVATDRVKKYLFDNTMQVLTRLSVRDECWMPSRRTPGKNLCNSVDTSYNNYVIMKAMASQITSFGIVYSTVLFRDIRKHQSSASLAFVTGEFPA